MRYVSIDIETTGLDTQICQVLSIGAVIEDTNNLLPINELPSFHAAILTKRIDGEPYAINMNRDLIQSIVYYQTARDQDEKNDLVQMTGMKFLEKDKVVEEFYYWLAQNGFVDLSEPASGGYVTMLDGQMIPAVTSKTKPVHISAAGKNFATFDLKFLENLPRWKQLIKVRQRILDPSVLFTDWFEDESLPSLGQCKERAGFEGTVAHDALEDCKDIVKLLRKKYN
jgi:DNA polymerase III epsilon subunit-like protein